MIGFLLGVMMFFAQPVDTTATLPVLHDSLSTGEYHTINLISIKGWKYKTGDDSTWAHPDFDDSDWLDSSWAADDSTWQGIGWLRLTLKVDSTFDTRQRVLNFTSTGASQLYINGKLIDHIGTPSADRKKEHIQYVSSKNSYPVFAFSSGKTYVIAVRYSYYAYPFYKFFAIGPYPLLSVRLNIQDYGSVASSIASSKEGILFYAIAVMVFFMVMLLHLAMYLRFREEKGNFWIFIISFFLFETFLFVVLSFFDTPIPASVFYLANSFSGVILSLTFTFVPISIGRLLEIPILRLWYYLPMLAFAFYLPQLILKQDLSLLTAIGFIIICVLVLLASIEIILKARKLHRKDIWYIAVPLLSFPLVFIFGSVLFSILNIDNPLLNFVLVAILMFSLPLGMSVYQMKRFFAAHGELEQEVKQRTQELNQSLEDLKATQSQLIQSEKLASLGQLTAGIAHEIKNPLNFVNNFSELSIELLEETREEVEKTNSKFNIQNSELPDLLDDIKANLKTIHKHGSRADSIVKSMLEHSRGGSGKLEPTDLNALVKEFVNLSFHGMRASNNPINVDLNFELDENIREVPLIAEDFSRVIVNLCNNAFDAMREKINGKDLQGLGGLEDYRPKLTVRTKSVSGTVMIEIEDNGPGIPEELKNKILQPFFTTKKGTEGTGLGLSITNDIIKAHGGTMQIETKDNEFTRFSIYLT